MNDKIEAALAKVGERLAPLTARVDALVKRVDNTVVDTTLVELEGIERMDAFPPGYKDEVYKGYKIIIGAGNTYAVFQNGTAVKAKLASVEAAKKWIDSK